MTFFTPSFFIALLLLALAAVSAARVRSLKGEARLYWLSGLVIFAFAGLMGALGLAIGPPLERAAFLAALAALTLGPPCFLLGAISGLLRPVPERYATAALAASALVYLAMVFSNDPSFFILVTGPSLVGLFALPVSRYSEHPALARWTLVGAATLVVGGFALVSTKSLAGPAVDAFRLAGAAASLAFAEAALVKAKS